MLENKNYIAFDTETSGLNDSNQFIKILVKIEEITKITNEILKDKTNEEDVIAKFIVKTINIL